MYRNSEGLLECRTHSLSGSLGAAGHRKPAHAFAGIEAMSILMDRVMSRASLEADLFGHATEALSRLAPHCRWTYGRWQELQRDWNEIQNVART